MLAPNKSSPIDVNVFQESDDYLPDFLRTKVYDTRYIRESLEKELPYWNNRCPVIIDAPTGRGKNTFIEQVVIPYAIALGRNIIIVSNRSALVVQEKIRIMKELDCYDEDMWTKKRIRVEPFIHSRVAVITYQSMGSFLADPSNQAWLKNVAFVIADEAHLLTADSPFNDMCGYYLKLLTTKFRHCIRIYMTATIWDVVVPLTKAEENSLDLRIPQPYYQTPRVFYHYCFRPNYNHIDLEFFDNMNEISKMVEDNPEQKIIVFVDNKDVGKALADEFGKKAKFIDRDKKDTDDWYALLDSEDEMPCQILICTSVFDCGINFKDPSLKHIYVITDDRTSFIQMIGRKRCTAGERFTVHVMNLSDDKLDMRYKNAINLLKWEDRYDKSDDEDRAKIATELWKDGTNQFRVYFKLNRGCNGLYLFKNELAFHKLHRTIKFYEKLINREVTFQNEVRRWLGKEILEEDNFVDGLTKFLESNVGSEINNDFKDNFRALVRNAYAQCGFKEEQPSRDIQHNALNNRLKEIGVPYRLTKDWGIEATSTTSKED